MTDNDHVGDVVGDLEADSWDVSRSRVREDAVVLTGVRDADAAASKLLALVVDAETEVTPKYVKYLVKTAGERDADTAFVSTVGTLTPDAQTLAAEYGVTVVDPEMVGASTATDADAQAAESAGSDPASAGSGGESPAPDATPESEPPTAADETSTGPAATEPERAGAAAGAGTEQCKDGTEPDAEQCTDGTEPDAEQCTDGTEPDAEPSRDAEFWTSEDDESSTEAAVSAAAAGSSASVTASDEPPAAAETRDRDQASGGHQPRATADSWNESPPPADDESLLARLTSGKSLVVVAIALLAVGLLVTGGGAGILDDGGDGPGTVGDSDPIHASETGEVASQEVNQTPVVAATGEVQDGSVDTVRLSVRQSAGANSINLSKATIQWVRPSAIDTLTWAETAGSTSFTTRAIKGDSATILNSSADRIEVVFDANAVAGGLDTGEEGELTIRTQYGSTTTYFLNIPDSLDGKDVVEL